MKIKMRCFGARFDLHCPKCGNTEFSEEIFQAIPNSYHKCFHCGSDIETDGETNIGIVIEEQYYEFTEHTYDVIRNDLLPRGYGWKLEERK